MSDPEGTIVAGVAVALIVALTLYRGRTLGWRRAISRSGEPAYFWLYVAVGVAFALALVISGALRLPR